MAHTDPHRAVDSIAVGHETADVNLGGVERLVVFLVTFLLVVTAIVYFVYVGLLKRETSRDQPLNPLAAAQRAKDPRRGAERFPTPRLQTAPYVELKSFREAEDRVLNGYAWIDKRAGVVQIPVSRAIDIIAERGIPPVAPAGTPGASAATGAPAASAPGPQGATPAGRPTPP
jgi:hypothetical protein